MGGIAKIGGEPAGANISLLIFAQMNRGAHAAGQGIPGHRQRSPTPVLHLLVQGKKIIPRQTESPANRHRPVGTGGSGENHLLGIRFFQDPGQTLAWRAPATQLEDRIGRTTVEKHLLLGFDLMLPKFNLLHAPAPRGEHRPDHPVLQHGGLFRNSTGDRARGQAFLGRHLGSG